MNSLKEYLKDLREVAPSASCTEQELLDYSMRHIRSFLKSKITQKIHGAELISVNELWKIIDDLS